MLLATQPQYLYTALQNFKTTLPVPIRNNPTIQEILNITSPLELSTIFRGIIGLSGVYNIPRLATSPFGETLINPTFGKQLSLWKEVSPVHKVGLGYDKQHIKSSNYTFLPTGITNGHIPILLLNAEEDFHLDQDSEELDITLAYNHLLYTSSELRKKENNIPNKLSRKTILRNKDYREIWKPKIVSTGENSSSTTTTTTTPTTPPKMSASPPSTNTTDTNSNSSIATEGLGTGITWLPGRSSFVDRCIIEGTNHLSVVSGMGQTNDPTTDAVFDFVKRIIN